MRKFKACLMCELTKLRLKKKYTVFGIIVVSVCVIAAMIAALLRTVTASAELSIFINMPMVILPLMSVLVIPLIGIMAVCDLFSAEYYNKTVKAQLMRPVSRFKIYLSKVLAAWILCTVLMLLTFGVTAVCSLVLGTADNTLYSLGAYLVDLIPVFVFILLAALLNQVTKGSTSAMFLCIIVYIGIKAAGIIFPIVDGLMFTSYLQWHRIWLGTAVTLRELLSKTLLLTGYGVTFFSGGYWLFISREY